MFAVLAGYAYADDCSSIFTSYNLSNYQHITNEDAHGHLAYNDKDLVIAFRGTNPIHFDDWFEDINAWPEHYNPGKVHMGFMRETDKLLPNVLEIIKSTPNRNVWICGHSLGGAVANLTAIKLVTYNICKPIVFTFGEPRSSNRPFANAYEFAFNHFRFVNCNDIVPRLPPIIFGYVHHQGILKYISFNGNLKPMTIWQIIKDQIKARHAAWKKGDWFNSVYDHSILLYIKKIKQFELNHE